MLRRKITLIQCLDVFDPKHWEIVHTERFFITKFRRCIFMKNFWKRDLILACWCAWSLNEVKIWNGSDVFLICDSYSKVWLMRDSTMMSRNGIRTAVQKDFSAKMVSNFYASWVTYDDGKTLNKHLWEKIRRYISTSLSSSSIYLAMMILN